MPRELPLFVPCALRFDRLDPPALHSWRGFDVRFEHGCSAPALTQTKGHFAHGALKIELIPQVPDTQPLFPEINRFLIKMEDFTSALLSYF